MTNNILKLNQGKTEFILFSTQQLQQKVSNITINVGTSEITPVKSVRNLGYFMDFYMTNAHHIGMICVQLYGTLNKNSPNQIPFR